MELDLATNLGISTPQLALGPNWREGSEIALEGIHDDPPMPQEIANGFYPAFEERWRKAEMAGRFAMLGFVLVCAAGLLGHGPFSERSLTNADRSISIRYEPVVRFGAPTILASIPGFHRAATRSR